MKRTRIWWGFEKVDEERLAIPGRSRARPQTSHWRMLRSLELLRPGRDAGPRCRDAELENVSFRAAAGMGLIAQRCRNVASSTPCPGWGFARFRHCARKNLEMLPVPKV